LSELKLFFLGPPRVEVGERPVIFHRRKNLAMLAYLAISGEPLRRETLAELFWPDSSRERTHSNLRRDLSELAALIGSDWLSIERDSVALAPGAKCWLDVQAFHNLLGELLSIGAPTPTPPETMIARLSGAVDLYRGDFLKGFSLSDCNEFDEWQFIQGERFRQDYIQALERLIQAHCALNDHPAAIPYSLRWLAVEPLNERVHRLVIELHLQANQVSSALRYYHRCVKLLKDELGVDLSPETQGLYRRMVEIQRLVNDGVFLG
jgi:DNA-binding SARP family transcriptional activator